MEVAVQAMDLAGIERRDLPYEELLNKHLPEYEFRGRRAQKIREPDLGEPGGRD